MDVHPNKFLREKKENNLFVDGFIYVRFRTQKGQTYWTAKECKARAITNDANTGEAMIVFEGPADSMHEHLRTLKR